MYMSTTGYTGRNDSVQLMVSAIIKDTIESEEAIRYRKIQKYLLTGYILHEILPHV
jgi:hypothetical protein